MPPESLGTAVLFLVAGLVALTVGAEVFLRGASRLASLMETKHIKSRSAKTCTPNGTNPPPKPPAHRGRGAGKARKGGFENVH